MKRTRSSWKRFPHTRPEANVQPSLDGSSAWTDLSVLREAIEDLQWAYDSTVEEVLRLRTENRSLRGSLEAAKAKLIEFAHQVYGRKSEKKRPHPAPAVETVATETSQPPAPPAVERLPDDFLLPEEPQPEPRRRGQQPGTAGHGRRRYPQLPANHQYFEASDEAQRCPRCGTYARKCGIDTSTQLEFVVEIRQQVAHRQRYRWVCECGGQDVVESDRNALVEGADFTPPAADPNEASDPSEASEAKTSTAIPRGFTAPGPLSVIPRGLFTNQLLIQVLAWKYLWGGTYSVNPGWPLSWLPQLLSPKPPKAQADRSHRTPVVSLQTATIPGRSKCFGYLLLSGVWLSRWSSVLANFRGGPGGRGTLPREAPHSRMGVDSGLSGECCSDERYSECWQSWWDVDQTQTQTWPWLQAEFQPPGAGLGLTSGLDP